MKAKQSKFLNMYPHEPAVNEIKTIYFSFFHSFRQHSFNLFGTREVIFGFSLILKTALLLICKMIF